MSKYAAAHRDPQGPGDSRPTALQIVRDEGLVGKLTDRVAFVTGANQGLGLETARALYATGATVYLGVRDLARGQRAIDDIKASDSDTADTNTTTTTTTDRGGGGGALHLVEISLDSLASVRRAAEDLLARSGRRLNLLVLNAGVMCNARSETADGFEADFGTNHLGHFLLFQLLRPALLASSAPGAHSRVVSVASQLHRAGEVRFDDYNFLHGGDAGYDRMLAYGQSKTANIYVANEIERRFGGAGLHGLSLHPGVVATNMTHGLFGAGGEEQLRAMLGDRYGAMMREMKSARQGAATIVYAALSEDWEGRGGRYLNNCAEVGPGAGPGGGDPASTETGYAPWAFDREKAERLWRESNKMVGLDEDA